MSREDATCPTCGDETESRLAIIEPSELKEEREYCLTCETFLDEDARKPE
jgi:hypothetical protein